MPHSISHTRLYRTEMNEKILGEGMKEFNRFFALDTAAYREGALPVKMKELMGLVGSMVLRCNDCIFYHLDRCVTEGASRQEIMEAMNISLVIGGSIVIPHLRYAFEMLEQLEAEPETEKPSKST
ncbi:MAG: carboxymuconolactone decarboxylase family protein [Ignavibacteriae bacterium]|nr:carboxymuconolactone decarboxylase family protein [Ignavibacteriota bacterium]